MTEADYWKIGMPTQLVSWACGNLSKRRGQVRINPHMLRHWYATELIRLNTNPEIVRRQLRHKNIETTRKIYVQINSQELEKAVIQRPQKDASIIDSNIVKLRLVK
jgi:integrase